MSLLIGICEKNAASARVAIFTACDRGQGAGKKVMQFIGPLAIERECRSPDWMAEKSNADSKRFYQALGGEILKRRHHFGLYGESLQQLAERR